MVAIVNRIVSLNRENKRAGRFSFVPSLTSLATASATASGSSLVPQALRYRSSKKLNCLKVGSYH